MLMLRKFHLYLGTLFAPAIIFFAASGLLQVIGLHEAEEADAVQPPAWIVTLASVHKDQHLPRPKARKPGALEDMRADHAHEPAHTHADGHGHDHDHDAATAGKPAANDDARPAADGKPVTDGKPPANAVDWSQNLLKAFAVLMAIGLIASTAIGIYIAVSNARTRRAAIMMLVLGLLLPLGFLAL